MYVADGSVIAITCKLDLVPESKFFPASDDTTTMMLLAVHKLTMLRR